MELKQILERLTELKSEIGELGKLPKEVHQKINYKFRLDWNYYSNRMEGGTLTREETRSVMVGNITVSGKPIKDVMEMNGHDEVVREILKMGKGEVRISEKRIKDIHRAIIKETDDHIKNRQIGKWKEEPNEIINYKGEKISFSAPADVAVEMHELLNNTNSMLDAYFTGKKDAQHPLVIAAHFHLGFVSIHPFFDGNGRTARILMNLILIACGYPPIIIDDFSKKAYYQFLADVQAYGGDKNLMYAQLAALLTKSLLLVKDAIEGKDIEEPDDIHKELALLDKEITGIGRNEKIVKRTNGAISKILHEVFIPIMFEMDMYWLSIRDYFENTQAILITDSTHTKYEWLPDGAENYISGIKLAQLKKVDFAIELNELKIALPKNKSYKYGFNLEFADYECKLLFNHYGKETIVIYYGDDIDKQYYKDLGKRKMKYFIEFLREDIKKLQKK